jgi:hypothetical protein
MNSTVGHMKVILSSLAGIPVAASFLLGGGHHQLGRLDVERALRNQMNGSPAGLITRSVRCDGVGAPRGATKYACVLTGREGTRERAIVRVDGGSWRADWAPLEG